MQFKIRPWLLWVAAVVTAGAIGYFGWYYNYKITGTSSSTTNPTPTSSSLVSASPATSPGTSSNPSKTSTPSSGQTATPTPTPQTSLPAGWKLKTDSISVYSSRHYGANYSVFVKESWQSYSNQTAHSPIFYTDNSMCSQGPNGIKLNYCYSNLIVSDDSTAWFGESSDAFGTAPADSGFIRKSYSIPDTNDQIWLIMNGSTSASDQKIITDSFKITGVSGL